MNPKSFLLLVVIQILSDSRQVQSFYSSDGSVEIERAFKSAVAGRAFICPFREQQCDVTSPYRSFDGTCNNLANTLYGSANNPYKRMAPAAYDKGSDIRALNSKTSAALKNPRTISLALNTDNAKQEASWSHLFANFGQFLTHEITQVASSSTSSSSSASSASSASSDSSTSPLESKKPSCPCGSTDESCNSINVPSGDSLGVTCMEFVRSAASFTSLSCDHSYREQMNIITSFIDGSAIYGSSKEVSTSVRLFSSGQLKTSAGIDSRSYLPQTADSCSASTDANKNKCFLAGDNRASENLGLSGIHSIFLREHNRIAGIIASKTTWDDEQVFQQTRRIMGAILQHIVYSQYIPSVIGRKVAGSYGLLPTTSGYTTSYDPAVNPGIYNEFAAAALRFGHTVVSNVYPRFNSNNRITDNTLTFSTINMNSDKAYDSTNGGIDSIVRGLVNSKCGQADLNIPKDLQNKLVDSFNGLPFDLAAFNIQRGRDHGVATYVQMLKLVSGVTISSFTDPKLGIPATTIKQLQAVYDSVEDVDLWIGGIAETRTGDPDKILGDTFTYIIAQQFLDLKKGDRFYYENAPDASKGTSATAFTLAQLNEIKKVSLSTLLCSGLDLVSVQPDPFFVAGSTTARPSNAKKSCKEFPSIDVTKFLA